MAFDQTKFRIPNGVRLGITDGQLTICLREDVVSQAGFTPEGHEFYEFGLDVDREGRNILIAGAEASNLRTDSYSDKGDGDGRDCPATPQTPKGLFGRRS